MALLPYLNPPVQSIEMISQFGGYNHKTSIPENDFYDMKNMSSRAYPLIATREKRGKINVGAEGYIEKALGLVAKEKLIIPYTEKGSIGITIAQNVAEQTLDGIPGTEIGGSRYTVIDMLTTAPVNQFYEVSEELNVGTYYHKFEINSGRYIYKDLIHYERPKMSFNDIRVPGMFLIKWPHESIGENLCWAEGIGYPFSFLKASEMRAVQSKTLKIKDKYGYLGNDSMRNSLVNADCYIGKTENGEAWQPIKITDIAKYPTSDYYQLTFQWTGLWSLEDLTEGRYTIVFQLSSPTEAVIPARDIFDWIRTEVEVDASTASAVEALLGQNLEIDGNTFHVSQIRTETSANYIYVDRPHAALSAGTTTIGDRLYLAEIDPTDGRVTKTNICAASSGKRHLIEMGGNLVIFPEKVMINTLKKNLDGQFNDIQMLEFRNMLIGNYAYRLCDVNGNFYNNGSVSNTAPNAPSDGHAWIDTTEDPPLLKVWSSQTSQWAITQPYCQIYSSMISESWQVGDAVELEFGTLGGGEYLVPQKEQKYFVISAVGKDDEQRNYIRFPIAVKTWTEVVPGDENDTITIKRNVPDMDFVIENENRLWGCKYGIADGKMINEIFACKQSDPKNWHHFTNTAIDSYYVSMGADGAFTGAISYLGNPLFFREDRMHRIFGNYPANYSLKTIECHGVEQGSDKSLTVMNDVLFYKSPVGIMAYTGATPINTTECFGTEKYKNAVSCALGSKMYFCMKDKNAESKVFVFDDKTKLWHIEDNLPCKDFAVYEGEIYALTESGELISTTAVNGKTENDFEWEITSGDIGYNTPFHKRITKINMRMILELGARADISIQYDSCGTWQHISNIQPSGKIRSLTIPIMPHRCDHFALKINGKGECRILSLTKHIEEGSDYD